MKSIMTSVSPYLCEKIANGDCKILVKKSAPKEVPFKAYIYATKPKRFYKCGAVSTSNELLWLANGKVEMGDGFKFWADGDEYQCLNGRVIGEFVCNEVEEFHEWELSPQGKFSDFEEERLEKFLTDACLSVEEIVQYRKNLIYCKPLYGLHISDLKIYDKPKDLSEFNRPCTYKGLCFSCDRSVFASNGDIVCKPTIIRPPQSYMYVEEIKER